MFRHPIQPHLSRQQALQDKWVSQSVLSLGQYVRSIGSLRNWAFKLLVGPNLCTVCLRFGSSEVLNKQENLCRLGMVPYDAASRRFPTLMRNGWVWCMIVNDVAHAVPEKPDRIGC